MSSEVERSRKKTDDSGWETVKVIIQALLIAFVVRTFFFQPFNIPSESMVPTLRVGDYLFVNKLSYGYSKYSFNFAFGLFGNNLFKFGPVPIQGRKFGDVPERGDVVVFKLPLDNETDYIKRVIGLPGDKIQMIDGVLHINGEAVKRKQVEDFVNPDRGNSPRAKYARNEREKCSCRRHAAYRQSSPKRNSQSFRHAVCRWARLSFGILLE